jgi:hypothetical protein
LPLQFSAVRLGESPTLSWSGLQYLSGAYHKDPSFLRAVSRPPSMRRSRCSQMPSRSASSLPAKPSRTWSRCTHTLEAPPLPTAAPLGRWSYSRACTGTAPLWLFASGHHSLVLPLCTGDRLAAKEARQTALPPSALDPGHA